MYETQYQIEFNPKLFPRASKETATVVILPPSIHTDCYMNGKNVDFHHGEMAATYIGLFAQALVDFFGTPRALADKLAWGGLLDTDAWKLHTQNMSKDAYANLVNTLEKHQNGTGGTSYCQQ